MELKKDYTIAIVTYNMQQAVRMSANTAFFLLGEVWNATIQKNCFQYRQIKERKTISQGGLVKAMRNRFDRQLHLLDEQLTHMGELCETAIAKATQALKAEALNRQK